MCNGKAAQTTLHSATWIGSFCETAGKAKMGTAQDKSETVEQDETATSPAHSAVQCNLRKQGNKAQTTAGHQRQRATCARAFYV